MAGHPTKNQLSAFLLGKLPPENGDLVGDHLENCPSCQQTVNHLEKESDTLMQNLRRPASPAPADPALKQGMQKASNLIPEKTDGFSLTQALPGGSVNPGANNPGPGTKLPVAKAIATKPTANAPPAPTTEASVALLKTANILSSDDWAAIQDDIAKAADGAGLLKRLIERQVLTKFQAQQIYNGKTRGLVFGDFVVLDKLGSGGMGQVFRARHRRMDRIVALKVMSAAAMKDAEAVKRFMREAQAAARLIHPNIVTAFDAGEADGIHFLAMEYVDGCDLSVLAKKGGTLSVSQAADYTLQAARGLAFAHGKGVIHRDIKPANLLLDKDGTVKILDMGLARLDGASAEKEGLTQSGQMMGTIDYIAPEQALNTRMADARSDIYSLGCTLYRMLTGESPFGGETMMEKLLAHREKPIPSLNTNRNDVPASLETIYRKMMAKDAAGRYQTMAEVVAELERFCSGQSTSADGPAAIDNGPSFDAISVSVGNPSAMAIQPNIASSKKTKRTKTGLDNKKLIVISMGTVLVVLLIVAGIVVTLQTADGTLVVKVDQPDAIVTVMNAEGRVEIDDKEAKGGKLKISVDPGKHRIKVEKDGFVVYSENFEITSGGTKTISAKLVKKASPAVAAVPGPAIPAPKATTLPTAPTADVAKTKPYSASSAAYKDPAFQQWLKDVSSLPALQKVEAVTKKMKELNSGFSNGKLSPSIVDGVVTELVVEHGYALDLSPLRAFPELEHLYYWSSSNKPEHRLIDLSPLTGMKIGRLVLKDVSCSDISPLEGMPLTMLALPYSKVSDLSPLRNMKLKSLEISKTSVKDISPLRGVPLTKLSAGHNAIEDLSPLQGMPLTDLSIGSTPITNISALRGLPLEILEIAATKVTDLSPLQGMPLTSLNIDSDKIEDLSPLKGMKLKVLRCQGVPVSDISMLLEMSTLMDLNLQKTKVSAADIAKLQQALPNCKIFSDAPQLPASVSTEPTLIPAIVSSRMFRGKPFAQVKMENAKPSNQLKVGAVYYTKQYTWTNILEELHGMLTQTCSDAVDASRGKLVFEAVKPGMIVITTTSRWGGGGSISPQMAAELTSRQQLLDQGWQHVGELGDTSDTADKYKFQVFARWAEAGEKFSIRTEKYVPPILIFPEPTSELGANSPPIAKAPFDAATAKKHQEAWAKYLGTEVATTNTVGGKMILIPPGEFLMGSSDEQVEYALKAAEEIKQADNGTKVRIQIAERPQHRVVITKPLRIGATEVTMGQFRAFVEATKYQTEGEVAKKTDWRSPGHAVTDETPVTQVTWNDACAYCNWLSEKNQLTPCYRPDGSGGWMEAKTGTGLRLPTEAEWEYACRAGTTTQYSFGDDFRELPKYTLFENNNCSRTTAVGVKSPNPFGLFDMHGNVLEWCQDYWDEKWYGNFSPNGVSLMNDPTGPSTGSSRVIRGGYGALTASTIRSAFRTYFPASGRAHNHGFRVAQEVISTANINVPSRAADTIKATGDGIAPPIAKSPFDTATAKKHQEAWAKHLGASVVTTNSVGMKLTLIPPGEFLMGSSYEQVAVAIKILEETNRVNEGEKRRLATSECPVHSVRITRPFRLGAHEVTVGQFAKFIEKTGFKTQANEFGGNSTKETLESNAKTSINWRAPGYPVTNEMPVTQITWNDAVAFCNWLSEQENLQPCYTGDTKSWTLNRDANGYRLPTEAEWEFACRAGTMTAYSFGDNWRDVGRFGRLNREISKDTFDGPQAVGLLPTNPFGLHDMHGNVLEWCYDRYTSSYVESTRDDPVGPAAGERTLRGGNWQSLHIYGRSAYRSALPQSYRATTSGFRVALGPGPSKWGDVPPVPADVPAFSWEVYFAGKTKTIGFFANGKTTENTDYVVKGTKIEFEGLRSKFVPHLFPDDFTFLGKGGGGADFEGRLVLRGVNPVTVPAGPASEIKAKTVLDEKLQGTIDDNLPDVFELVGTSRKNRYLQLSVHLTGDHRVLDGNKKLADWSSADGRLQLTFVDPQIGAVTLANNKLVEFTGNSKSQDGDDWTWTLTRVQVAFVWDTEKHGRIVLYSNGRVNGGDSQTGKGTWSLDGDKFRINLYFGVMVADRATINIRHNNGSWIKGTRVIPSTSPAP